MQSVSSRVLLAMPVYNGENFVAEALESILAQSYRDFALIVTDNASSDRTGAIVREFAANDTRITYIRNAENLGASRNYNLGFELSECEYMKWCAHDDLLSANYLGDCVAALDADPSLSIAFGRTVGIDAQGFQTPPAPIDTPNIDDDNAAVRFDRVLQLFGRMCFPIFGLMRRSALEKTMLHESYYGSDQALLAELALRGKWERIEDAILWNREHGDRSLNVDDKLERSKWQGGRQARIAAAEHIQLLIHLNKICGLHNDVARPSALRRAVWSRALEPMQLGRYALEITSLVSPRIARGMKSMVVR